MITAEYVADTLSQRAAAYGGTLGDMLARTPVCLWDSPNELLTFWSEKDLSHVFPQSEYPELAQDWSNIVAEDSSINRARGARVMTELELSLAEVDAEVDASLIDVLHTDDDAEFAEAILELAGM
jgi:hypothetical protein